MRRRPSSRLLVLDPANELLLFRFIHKSGPLAGQDFWATPGGGLESGESFTAAAIRELRKETGIVIAQIGKPIARREFTMTLPGGEQVIADEQFFTVRADGRDISRDGLTALEIEVMADHRWWSEPDLAATLDTVWPGDLPQMLRSAGYW
ncbi:MAG: NUDIX domain-containing protein [Burkholderiaceae bacterium]|nr:NUDIX domain-containing protein [Burkholderiaceae bacterium]